MLVPLESPVFVIRDARRLLEGQGVRFRVVLHGVARDAFVVRHRGVVHAFVNQCRHQALPLDFGDAHFFDEDYDALVCVQHGARFDPASGECRSGPCQGRRLTALGVEERDGALWCVAGPG